MLEVKKINVCYDDAQALWDISFTVCKGEIVKSTTNPLLIDLPSAR